MEGIVAKRKRTVGLEEREVHRKAMTPERIAAMAAGRLKAGRGRREAGAALYETRAGLWAEMGQPAMASYFHACAEEVRAGTRPAPDPNTSRTSLETPTSVSD